jgi:HD-like signal output (HDOD) protein
MHNLPAEGQSAAAELPTSAPGHTLLEELCADPSLSGLGLAVVQIVELIDRAGSAIPELTRATLVERFIAQKLLRAANAALHRRATGPVTHLSKAIVVLGFEQVRTLALSTLLLSKLADRKQAHRLEEEFAGLLYAVTLAREIAGAQGLCDPEEAAVCTLFRFFGRLVVALYRYEFYEQIVCLSKQERISENQAAVRVLGLGLDKIGMELLTRWGMPQRIVHTLLPCPEPIRFSTSVEARLQTLAAFCMELTLKLRQPALIARRQNIEALLQRFGPALRLERQRLKRYLELADVQAQEISQALGLAVCPIAGEVFDEASTLTFSPLNRPQASLVLRAGLVTLNRMLSQNEPSDATLMRACDILHRAFAFQRVTVFCALSQLQTFSLRALAGKSANEDSDTERLQISAQDNIARDALLNNVDLYIRSSSDDWRGQSGEHWFSVFPDAKSFVLLPLARENLLLGLIYADHSSSNVQGWTSEEKELVQAIKQVVGVALKVEPT